MREKRLGLFGNAKYSRPVFKNVPEAVVKGVEKDIALLVRHEPVREVRKWTTAPRASGDADDSSLAGSAAMAPPLFAAKSNNVRRSLFKRGDELPGPSRNLPIFQSPCINALTNPSANGDPTRHLRELLTDSSGAKRRRLDTAQVYMPAMPPMESIEKNILSACPKITLRDSDSMRYAEQVFAITHNSLKSRASSTMSAELSLLKANAGPLSPSKATNSAAPQSSQAARNLNNSTTIRGIGARNTEPFQTLCNKTAIFDDDDDSDGFDESEAFESESPTRVFATASKAAGEKSDHNLFEMSAFHTQSDPDSSGSDNFCSAESRRSVSPWRPPTPSTQNVFFAQPLSCTNKSVSFHFGDQGDDDDDDDFARVQSPVPSVNYPPSESNFVEPNNTQFFQREGMFLDNLSFDFGNNASAASEQ